MTESAGYATAQIAKRDQEISRVKRVYGFQSSHELHFPAGRLDTVELSDIIKGISSAVKTIKPHTVYVPYPGDIHTDHRVSFQAAISSCKSFRQASVKRLLAYETISETDFGLDPAYSPFKPNVFIDVSRFIAKKISILKNYESELGPFPFPRSVEAVKALAVLRGAESGFKAAEAFMLLKEISV